MMRWTHELLTRCLRRLAQSACLLCVCVATLLSVGSTAMAQDRIDATVVSVSGRSVYINAGRDAGVLSGARVVFRLKSGTLVEATIADVSANNARAELTEDSLVPSPDDHATVEVETPATNPPAGTAPTPTVPRAVPEHPPWQQTEGARKPDTPLLSPAFGSRPEDQPMVVKGRTYSTMRVIRDLEHDSDYIFARTGLWLDIRNPMRDGGRLRFQGDTDYRSSSTDFDSESETQARVQRFSYAWGLDKDAPFRGEVGRFYSSYLPELGTVDGIEGALRLENGWSLGAGGGLYPTTTQDLVDSDDMGFHLFADYQSDGTARAF